MYGRAIVEISTAFCHISASFRFDRCTLGYTVVPGERVQNERVRISGGIVMNLFKILIAASVVAFGGASANAATVSCGVDTVQFTLEIAVDADCFAGNDLGNGGIEDGNLEILGYDGWTLGDSTGATGDGVVTFSDTPTVGATSGTWGIASYGEYDPLLLILKSGPYYGGFLISEAVSGLSGSWSILDLGNEEPKQLSHTSLYYGPIDPIPLPAAGWLLLGGLGGLAAMKRRRKS